MREDPTELDGGDVGVPPFGGRDEGVWDQVDRYVYIQVS